MSLSGRMSFGGGSEFRREACGMPIPVHFRNKKGKGYGALPYHVLQTEVSVIESVPKRGNHENRRYSSSRCVFLPLDGNLYHVFDFIFRS